ncbi:MAG: putative O-methyltransferase YrrM [Patiriisocius sp.]|jgi:predicted O-methyltransferase YrrM
MTNTLSTAFLEAAKELEELATNYVKPGDTQGYEGVWLPPDGVVRMWSVPRSTADFLKTFVEEHTPLTTLELGTSSGYSTLFMAAGARSYGGKVFSIEMAQPKIDIAQSYINRVGFTDDITIIKGEIAQVLASWDQKIDLVFLDADKLNYLQYIQMLEPHLNAGAIIIADNAVDFAYLMPDYIAYMKESGKYQTQLLAMDNGLLISTKI